ARRGSTPPPPSLRHPPGGRRDSPVSTAPRSRRMRHGVLLRPRPTFRARPPNRASACSSRSAHDRGRRPPRPNRGRGSTSARASRRGARRAAPRPRRTWRRVRRFHTYGQYLHTERADSTLFASFMWSIPPYVLEAGQVLAHLPRGDLLVVAEPLVALHLGVVVDVVLVACLAEGRAEDVVALELADRRLEVRGQGLETARG